MQYDTIREIHVRSKADEMASLIKRMAQKRKNKEKLKPSSSDETVQAKVYGDSLGGRSETTGGGVGFLKEVGFKPGVKERESYRST